jgi:hypothetical protein
VCENSRQQVCYTRLGLKFWWIELKWFRQSQRREKKISCSISLVMKATIPGTLGNEIILFGSTQSYIFLNLNFYFITSKSSTTPSTNLIMGHVGPKTRQRRKVKGPPVPDINKETLVATIGTVKKNFTFKAK